MKICESSHFNVFCANEPHLSREDGGHLVIVPKERIPNRWDLSEPQSNECMNLSKLVGQSMLEGLNERKLDIRRINFQDNGNWEIDHPKGPNFHLHLYGRAFNAPHQTHGEALHFSNKETQFWKDLNQLDEDDVKAIQSRIRHHLTHNEKFKGFEVSIPAN